MKNKVIFFLLLALLVCVDSLWAQDNQVQEIRLSPVADTFVSDSPFLTWVGTERKEERTVNFGNNNGLKIIRGKHVATGGYIYWLGTLIRFDLSEIPPGANILEAKLCLYHYDFWDERISVHRMLKSWTELGATWRQPCQECEPWWQGWPEGNHARLPVFSQRVTADRWFSWDVTEDVKAILLGNPNYGWFLKSAETTGSDLTSVSFHSRESKNPNLRPYLKVRFHSVPLPLTVEITSPTDGSTVNATPLTVTGTVSDPSADISVNGITPSLSGNTFQVSLDLGEGPNSITAQATDQYGQTATDSVTVILLTKGTVAGTVTDSQSGLVLFSAMISITDALNASQTAISGSDGAFTISNVASGAFSGSITKGGYAQYPISGNASPGQTVTINAALNPVYPTISNVAVSGITASSATITWTTDQPADSRVDYGTTISYGSFVSDPTLATTHRVILMGLALNTTYHLRTSSANAYGFSSFSGDYTFKSLDYQGPILLNIDSPKAGASLSKSEVLVEGSVSHAMGLETGVLVNGNIAVVSGNRFIANRVSLAEGQNQIVATATDVDGNTATTSVTVNATPSGHYVRVTANIESGMAPLETILTINTSLDPSRVSVTYEGPADVEFLLTSVTEYHMRLNAEGTYFFTAEGTDSVGVSYNDTIALSVLSKEALDILLRGKWEEMEQQLQSQNPQGALAFFVEEKRELYNEVFNTLYQKLPMIVQEMQDIQLIYVGDSAAKYRIRRNEFHAGQMVDITYYIYFVRDKDGLWRIYQF